MQLIIKPFENGFDLMHLDQPEDLNSFNYDVEFNTLIDGRNDNYTDYKLFDYHFGFNNDFIPSKVLFRK